MQFLTTKNIGSGQLDILWKTIGWKPRGAKWKEVIRKSSFVCSVWDKNNLVAFGRITEDGIMCMFYDIGVHPDYQKRNVGTKLMEVLVSQVKDKNYASIGLFAWEGNFKVNTRFYEKFGFRLVKTGMELEKYMERE